ncbi:MAG: hypothetical protein ABW009_08690 [Acidimicrobiales bacterium]
MRRITAGAVVLLLAAGCSSGGDDSASTTLVPSTTLPPSSTSTTLPARAVTEVDVCALLNETELTTVLDDAGAGEGAPVEEAETDGGVPAFVAGSCSWPSAADPALVLSYLAPTTAPSGPQHLEDVLATDTGFAEGGQVVPRETGSQTVGLLLDDERMLREVAVVKRSALLYLIVNQDVSGRDEDALTAYSQLLVAALVRAPR